MATNAVAYTTGKNVKAGVAYFSTVVNYKCKMSIKSTVGHEEVTQPCPLNRPGSIRALTVLSGLQDLLGGHVSGLGLFVGLVHRGDVGLLVCFIG